MTSAASVKPAGKLRWAHWAFPVIVFIAVAAVLLYFGKTHLSKTREEPITSIAVLPLQNLSPDPEQEYFSDGMTEAIIKELSQIKALRVISRTSVMQYKNTQKTIPDIARELGIDAVVEGSVLRAGGDVRITARLIAAHPEKHLWADDFTRSLENILALQSEVAQAITREINVAVTPEEKERLAASRPVNPEAHEAYLKGQYFVAKSTPPDWYKSIEYFQQAIDKDSTYALAYAGMARAYDNMVSFNLQPPREAWPKVRAYAEKALSLDPTLAEGVLLIADVTFCFDWDLKRAEEYFRKAIELDPNLSLAHCWYGFFLTVQGRSDEGIPEMKRGLHLDPLAAPMMEYIILGHAIAGEYDSAFVYVQRAAEIETNTAWLSRVKAQIYVREGKYAQAIEEGKIAVSGNAPFSSEDLAAAYALSGQTGKARQTLAELLKSIGEGRYYSAAGIAFIYCALGDRERVFEYLEKAYEERDARLIMPALAPWCDPIKSDPRYHEMMKKVGIEQ